ncbi:MAG: UDP-glucose 4-epimerase GalE, partial [Verrucomicrobiota bacterium]
MKVFVTGGAGYIGSICVETLLDEEHDVVVFDNLTEGHRKAIDERATFIEGDFADKSLIQETLQKHRPDAVMHFAANALVGESMTDPTKYFRNNVANGLNLIEAMLAAGVKRLVFSSTCATYGIPEAVPLHESLPQRPINPYGQSKLMFEQMLRWISEIHDFTHVNLRYFNAAGASEKFGEDHRIETHLIPLVLQVALGKRENIKIFGNDYPTEDGTCIRDYIHIRDLASAHIMALNADQSDSFNLGTGQGNSVKEIIDTARKVTGHEIPALEEPRRAGDPPKLVADSSKIKEALGWKPKYENIEKVIQSAW